MDYTGEFEFWMWWLKEAIPAAWRIVYGTTDHVIGQR